MQRVPGAHSWNSQGTRLDTSPRLNLVTTTTFGQKIGRNVNKKHMVCKCEVRGSHIESPSGVIWGSCDALNWRSRRWPWSKAAAWCYVITRTLQTLLIRIMEQSTHQSRFTVINKSTSFHMVNMVATMRCIGPTMPGGSQVNSCTDVTNQ
jgi:hypothetical protein